MLKFNSSSVSVEPNGLRKVSNKSSIHILTILLILISIFSCRNLDIVHGAEKEVDNSFITNSFDVDIYIQDDYTFKYSESINVDFKYSKHGIYRYIPVDHSRYSISIDKHFGNFPIAVESLWLSGRFPVHTVKFIKMGDKDIYISGNTTFNLNYDLKGKISKNNNGDKILLNLLPTRWPNDISNSTIRIHHNKSIDFSKSKIYFGDELSQNTIDLNSNFSAYQESSDTFVIKAYNIPANQGLTIETPLGNAYWTLPYNFEDFAFIFGAGAFTISILFIVIFLIRKRGYKIPPTVEFYPPENLPPADIGYIIDSTIDPKDISSMLLYFANKGYLSVEPIGESVDSKGNPKNFIFKKINDIDYDEPYYAQSLFNMIFDSGSEFRTDDESENFALASELAKEQLDYKYRDELVSKTKKGFTWLINLLTTFFTGYTLYFSAIAGRIELIGVFGVIAIISLLSLINGQQILINLHLKKDLYSNKEKLKKKILAYSFIAVTSITSVYFYSQAFTNFLIPLVAFILLFVTTIFINIAILGRISKNMAVVKARIIGFKHFIEVSEKDRIQLLAKDNPNYFFDILPYAFVLGVSDVWIKNLEYLENVSSPSWYYNSSPMGFHHYLIARSLLRSSQRAYTNSALVHGRAVAGSMLSQGAGSILKGGGFSGGGFGGGGGGSW